MPVGPLPYPPDSKSWNSAGVGPWGMLGNDTEFDSTTAAACHQMMCWSTNSSGAPWSFEAADAIADYKNYKSVGDGADPQDILRGWRAIGIHRQDPGQPKLATIDAFALLDINNADNLMKQVAQAIVLLGGCYIGLQLPKFANVYDSAGTLSPLGKLPPDWNQTEEQLKSTKDEAKQDKDARHCVVAIGYDQSALEVVTWGLLTKMSWAFFFSYYRDAWAVLCTQAWAPRGQTPDGRPLDVLRDQFAALKAAGQG
jgi:hypothetical protein